MSYADGRRQVLDRGSDSQVASLQRYTRFKVGHPAGFIEAFANLYVDIADCLHEYRETGCWSSDEVFSAELALEGMNMLEAMVKSAHQRRWKTV